MASSGGPPRKSLWEGLELRPWHRRNVTEVKLDNPAFGLEEGDEDGSGGGGDEEAHATALAADEEPCSLLQGRLVRDPSSALYFAPASQSFVTFSTL